MPGTLVFKPIEANLDLKDKDLAGKMDPYCLFHVGIHKVKSRTSQSGGQHPHWNDAISCEMPSIGGIVQVDLKDKDMLVDDKLGTFELDLNEVASLGQVRKWYPIFSKDRPAGEILIETSYNGSGMTKGAPHQGHGQHQEHGLIGGIPTTQSTVMTGVRQPDHTQHIPQQQFTPQQGMQSSTQPLQFSGVQANVIPVGGVPSSVEQYATEALMRGVDPLNTQQHYNFNLINGSTNAGYSGIPISYSTGNAGDILQKTPQSLTQTPLYSGSQPLQYEGNEGNSTILANTHTTGHHNEGFAGKVEQKVHNLEDKFGRKSVHPF